jgi:putative oxidoreductase
MATHGYAKFFSGGRTPGIGGWFDSIGGKPGALHARLAPTTEVAAGPRLGRRAAHLDSGPGFVALMR